MPNTPLNKEQLKEKLSSFSGQGAHACYCERSTDGGCTCALKDEYTEELVDLILADRDAAVREARKLHIGDKTVVINHTAVNKDAHLFIDGLHDPSLCPECIKPGTLSFQSQPNAKEE